MSVSLEELSFFIVRGIPKKMTSFNLGYLISHPMVGQMLQCVWTPAMTVEINVSTPLNICHVTNTDVLLISITHYSVSLAIRSHYSFHSMQVIKLFKVQKNGCFLNHLGYIFGTHSVGITNIYTHHTFQNYDRLLTDLYVKKKKKSNCLFAAAKNLAHVFGDFLETYFQSFEIFWNAKYTLQILCKYLKQTNYLFYLIWHYESHCKINNLIYKMLRLYISEVLGAMYS